jgi:Protein of unknown function (DUF935)
MTSSEHHAVVSRADRLRWPRWLGGRSATQQPAPPAQNGPAEIAVADTLWGPGFLQGGGISGGAYGGKFAERYNPDLLVREKGWAVYERMLRDDQISACLAIVNAAVSSRDWSLEVTDESAQGAALEFLRFTFDHALHGTIRQLLDQMLSARVFGFALVEKVRGVVDWRGRPYWGLSAFKLRPAWSFTFCSDAFGNVESLVQNQQGTRVELDPCRFVHFVFQPEIDPHYGRSALIPAYEHWWSKSNVLKFWNIYLERMASGFLHGKKSGPLAPADHATLQQALANVQAASSLLTPDSVTLQYVTPPNTTAFHDREGSLNRAIARALLVPTHLGLTDQGSTGSRAQADSQIDVFFWWLDALCTALEDAINEQVIRELVAWNFGDVPPPRFRFERRTPAQRREIAKAWADAVAAGVVVHAREDELRVRNLLDMPDTGGTGVSAAADVDDGAQADQSTEAKDAPIGPSNPISTATEWVRVGADRS